MREIKVREWCPTDRNMSVPFVLGSPKAGDAHDPDGIIMQYTGLKDKDGREIYEGDIVVTGNYPDIPAEVILGKVSFMIDYLSQDGDLLTPAWIEVVGNVYANPGLLEGK